jgi:hypothetical protein
MDEIEVECHQLRRRIAVVRLVIGRLGMQVGREPPRGDAEESSVFARPRHRLDVLVFACRAHEQADLQQPPGGAGGVAHAPRLLDVQCQRAFAEHVLACRERRNHDVAVSRARQADIDGVDVGALDQLDGVGDRLGLADGGHASGALRVAGEHADHGHVRHGGVDGRMHGPHAAGAQKGDAKFSQASPPA